MAVWRDLVPVTVDTDFEINVGINCVEGCSLLGQSVNLYLDDELVSTVVMGQPVAPREGLFWAVAKLRAPKEIGLYKVFCRMEPEGLELQHAPVETTFVFTTDLPAQARLHVTCLDLKRGIPVSGADINVRATGGYPYRLRANDQGESWIDLPYGEYRIGAICAEYQDVEKMVTLSEGVLVLEVTLQLPYDPDQGV
jgi:hypothetical protein